MLSCTGWLSFVEAHVCQVSYVETLPSDAFSVTFGRADCQNGRIEVARSTVDNRGRVMSIILREMVATIVHEAAHLEDGCRQRESPARDAESAFRADYETVSSADQRLIMAGRGGEACLPEGADR